ncbi:transposase family protein [Streptomyces sp. NPDC002012]|uniref:transposase family protein n=1 Tax=unclassified Streptomyces TaxID=2593676 RepID=UPI002E0FA7F1|nr:transposase family protein [Streptomyces sp. NBC_01224]
MLAEFARIPDQRAECGRRFPLPSLLALSVCALTPAGNDSLTTAAEWCQRATDAELAAFQLPYDLITRAATVFPA